MDEWKRWFALLLPLCVCAYSREIVVKAVGRGPEITPVCSRENLGMIILVTCGISTERHRGEDCRLLYVCDKQFDYECDSRFTLINENQTVFIHLTSLTPEDSGSYTCECSYERGTHVAHLNITVEADEEDRKFIAPVIIALTVATAFIITAAILCGHILRRNHHRENTRSGASDLTRYETPQSLDHDDTYASLQQPTSDVYQTTSSSRPHHEAEKDFHPIYAVYESI